MHSSGSETAAIGNFEQPILTIAAPASFKVVHGSIERAFSPAGVEGFLRSLARGEMRIREFEAVLNGGMLGAEAKAEYAQLGNADQGQIREFYLASLERVAPALRQKYLKLYAYY